MDVENVSYKIQEILKRKAETCSESKSSKIEKD